MHKFISTIKKYIYKPYMAFCYHISPKTNHYDCRVIGQEYDPETKRTIMHISEKEKFTNTISNEDLLNNPHLLMRIYPTDNVKIGAIALADLIRSSESSKISQDINMIISQLTNNDFEF